MWCESIGADVPAGDLFDATMFGRPGPRPEAFGLEVVALPGHRLPTSLRPGWLVLGRAMGEGRLAWLETVADGRVVSSGGGTFVEVGPTGRLRRVADDAGRCLPNTLVLRPAEDHGGAESFESFEPSEYAAEVATDPAVPVLPAIRLAGSVGRRGRNLGAEVTAIQQRLRDLQFLSAADFTAEAVPAGTASVPDARLPRTIAAIEAFQREVVGIAGDGNVGRRGSTLRDLNRAVPRPTAAQYAAITTQRATIAETVIRGVTITAAVGRTAAGNTAADVTAVQNRLVQLGYLDAAHGEAPTGAAAMTQAQLPRTIAAIVAFQNRRVSHWRGKHVVTGALTAGVVAPGDATRALLDLITTWDETFPAGAGTVRLSNHVASRHTRSVDGVMLTGTARPRAIPVADYVALGLTADDAAALSWVGSHHEGQFDAINTYDRARVSVGFIQFAGGRGLPPYLALLKSRQPVVFRSRLGQYGIDVEFAVDSAGKIVQSRVVVLDPTTSTVLRGTAAEEAIRADKRLSAAFVMSGRDRVVQLVQIESAIRGYVIPPKALVASWGTPAVRAPLGDVIRSQRGRAMIFDRAIQQGGAQQFVDAIRFVHARTPMADLAAAQAREAAILAQAEANLVAGSEIDTALRGASTVVVAMRRAADARGATVAGVLATAGTARTHLDTAVAAIPRLSPGAVHTRLSADLPALRTRLAFTPPPATVAALRTELDAIKAALGEDQKKVGNYGGFGRRLANIRTSTLTGP